MLAIEIDGDTHAHQQHYDAIRTRFLEGAGFHVLRFTNAEVMTNIEGVLHRISQALTKKRKPNSPSLPFRGEGRGEGPR